MSHLGELEQLLLFALLRLEDGAWGVPIRREIEKRTGRQVSAGAVYTALARLERRGFVASWLGESTPQRGGRRKRCYRMEAPGRAALSRSYRALAEMAHGQTRKLEARG